MKHSMNQLITKLSLQGIFVVLLFMTSCDNTSEEPEPELPIETGNKKEFVLFSASTGLPGGSILFSEMDDNSTKVVLSLTGLDASANHPAHIHDNSGAKGGGIAISLGNVEGASGMSETIISKLDDGTAISYNDLINFNGHVNVHLSESELGTLVAQGDIGPNEFTTNIEDYDLFEISGSGVGGDVTFVERVSGEILAIIFLEHTTAGGAHPAHVHLGSVASGEGISISLNPVNGDNGISLTDFTKLDDETPISFSQLKEFEGHVKVHLSSTELGTVISAGDIGGNKLTGEMMEYQLESAAVEGISGTATFKERKSGKTLVEISLQNTTNGDSHPSHIHANSAVEGGGVMIPLNNVNGDTGLGQTDVSEDKNQNPLTYEDLIAYDGHIMVHLSTEEMSTIVARGDIGDNMLTDNNMSYDLTALNGSGISGTIMFAERKSGFTLATINLSGTNADGDHPAHIHANDIATGGGIIIDLTNVDGQTGMSQTHIEKNNSGDPVSYEDLIDFDGHVKVHLSAENLSSVIAGGDIGSNQGSGAKVSYANDIRPILDANCQVSGCHGSNSGIPSWATYNDVSANASTIKSRTSAKTMPPSSSGKSLTDEQIQLIADWVDEGALNN